VATLRQIQETLSQSTGAQYLFQPTFDRALFEATRKFTTTRFLNPRVKWNTPKYFFNKRTNYPQVRAVVEAPPTTGVGSVSATNSNYSQVVYNVKHWQAQMDLANFSIQTARVNGDLLELETKGATESAMWWEEAVNFYGSGGATLNTYRPQYDGYDMLMTSANKINANQAPSIALYDAMIDQVKKALGTSLQGKYAFVISPENLSASGRLFVQNQRWMGKETIFPRDNRGKLGAPVTDNMNYIGGGVELLTYRNVPFMESSFLTPLGTMSTVTASATGTDGVIPAGTYYYSIEVVTDYGASFAYEVGPVTVSSTNHVALSWTAPTITDANGNTRQNLHYRIFRTAAGGAAGSETLYAVVSASDITYDDIVNHPVQSWTDTGAIVDPTATSTAISTTVAVSSGIAAPDGYTTPHLNTTHNAQDIFLIPRDPDILCVPVVNELKVVPLAIVNARSTQVALIGDQVMAVRGPGFMAKASNVFAS
jgi:hypothetical protein